MRGGPAQALRIDHEPAGMALVILISRGLPVAVSNGSPPAA
jgi:hypothetical protein